MAQFLDEQALRPQDEGDEEDEMLGEDLPGGVDLRTKVLRDADDDRRPASVPHRLPRPPSTTASKAASRRLGPIAGSKFVQTDMQQAAASIVTPTMPIATG